MSHSFTQFSTLAKTHTTTAREPSIYSNLMVGGEKVDLLLLHMAHGSQNNPILLIYFSVLGNQISSCIHASNSLHNQHDSQARWDL